MAWHSHWWRGGSRIFDVAKVGNMLPMPPRDAGNGLFKRMFEEGYDYKKQQ